MTTHCCCTNISSYLLVYYDIPYMSDTVLGVAYIISNNLLLVFTYIYHLAIDNWMTVTILSLQSAVGCVYSGRCYSVVTSAAIGNF